MYIYIYTYTSTYIQGPRSLGFVSPTFPPYPYTSILSLRQAPRELSIFRLIPQSRIRQKKSAPGTQKAVKMTPKSRLDINRFTKDVKKWNLTKTTVFVMFLAHPTSDAGVISTPKLVKIKPKNQPCKLVALMLTKIHKLLKIDPQECPRLCPKSMKIQPWTLRCLLWCPCGPLDR